MTFDDVVDLLAILDGSRVPTTIDYRNGPLRVRIERGRSDTAPVVAPASVPESGPSPTSAGPAIGTTPPEPEGDGAGTVVRAPIAGVFYQAPSPGADPYVVVGQEIEADTIVGIIEVMKLMNTVRSGVAGSVTEICAENAALVEYDQPLIRVRPAGGEVTDS
jgi:acetyl-CoA carboxylase biotin carboxyl carrier protein